MIDDGTPRSSHGWDFVARERKRELIKAIVRGHGTPGPVHAEIDLTDRCNIACYFCNQQDLRTKEQIPLKRTRDLIDELVSTGLRSVRLSGGGDPLFHREILDVLDHLAARGVIVDNLTTNAVALGPEVAKRLVSGNAREVVVSLNAVDAADYARMMQVKPALFDKVLSNVRHLIAVRKSGRHPAVTIQFLLDRQNFHRLEEMYDLGASLGPDRIGVNAVLEIPRDRIERHHLLRPEDREAARPHIEAVLAKDKDAGLLQIDFAIWSWNEMIHKARAKVGTPPSNDFKTASSFRDKNGGCFFAWYTTAITGNGDIRPCCLLLNPDVKPLGNINDGSFREHWEGPAYTRLREEMRDVLLSEGNAEFTRPRFQLLEKQCVVPNLCWLKNMYFRADEDFYRDLDLALTKARRQQNAWFHGAKAVRRWADVFFSRHPTWRPQYEEWLDRTRAVRVFLKKYLRLDVTNAR